MLALFRFMMLCCALFVASAAAQARAPEYKVGAPAPWVSTLALPAASGKPELASGGQEYLLSDVQRRIDTGTAASYIRLAAKAVDSSGLDDIARFSVLFDPSYQSVTLHAINLHRGGQTISKLKSSTIQVLQRETEMETRIYDGRKTINVEIDDVRVGDVVDYAYTVSGTNPVFGNQFAGRISMQWGVPVARVAVRLLVHAQRPMRLHDAKAGVKQVMTESGGYRDYRWDRAGVPALRTEKDAPAGYDPYAFIEWSDYADWSAVARWAVPLYRRSAPAGPELEREIARIAAASADPGERLLAALRVVQRDIRYLGVEAGASSHAPAAAAVVFKRRFGDCKDKAMLLLAMLDALGISAHPALVNTDRLRAADVAMASPNHFNHVLVRATVEGKHYWIDPTRGEQFGDLAHLYQPDYGLTLVLDEQTTALTAMASPVRSRKTVTSVFDSSAGLTGPAGMVVTTVIEGRLAEQMRSQLAARGNATIEQDYLNYYARSYPSVVLAGPMQVVDDKSRNTMTITEHYSIPEFWPKADKNGRQEASVSSPEIITRLASPKALNRTAPLPIEFPEEIDEITIIKLQEAWNLTPREIKIDDPAFAFSHRTHLSDDGKLFTITDTYRALADRVEPEQIRSYAAKLTLAADEIGYTLHSMEPGKTGLAAAAEAPVSEGSQGLDWRAGMFALLVLIAFGLGLTMSSAPGHRVTDGMLLGQFLMVSGALVVLVYAVDARSGQVKVVCVALAVMAWLAHRIARRAEPTHYLQRTEGRVRMARDMLAGSALTVLIVPQLLAR